ncbi:MULTISPECIES: hypothetical protein [Actinopolyspora]|uniref:Uncharacterized protein n=1 Tax=Actinopolyspora saharensis TaxID=995062 RepID=A0A1H1FT49_9ACTN|nr:MULTISPECIES: hypothetical protein [Actinopolyspora]NHD19490.1 hypothetical protein [Actinopolyspora sp. BKK2]NHE77430.1 hypothetical protein [Actinopolyspora sp. BKK1]SDR04192.1 hypothetical protein SAMN04489718_3225 [Actinopolyspora saharensis]
MNTAIVMMGALLPILAASVFYVSDRRVSPQVSSSSSMKGGASAEGVSGSGEPVLETAGESTAPGETAGAERY